MNIVALVISLFSALISFLQGGCGTVLGGIGVGLSQRAGDRTMGKEAALIGGSGMLIMIAAIAAIVGGLLAYSRKKSAPIVLGVSAGLCALAGSMGLKDGFVWGTLYAIAAVCAHVDMQKQKPQKAEKPATDVPMPPFATAKAMINVQTPAITNTVKKTVVYEPIVGVETAALVKRAFLFLEDGSFEEADRYFEQALNQDPENSKAYVGKLLVELGVKREEDLPKSASSLDSFNSYQKAIRFAGEDYKAVLVGYNLKIFNRTKKEAEQERIKDEEERINAENLRAKAEEEFSNSVYDGAVSSKEECKTAEDFRQVAEKFRSLGSFKDSDTLAVECGELANKAQTTETEKRKDNSIKIISLIVGAILIALLVMWFVDDVEKRKIAATEKLFQACQNGTIQQVESAIKDGANVNAIVGESATALGFATAAKNANLEIIKALIAAGADVNAEHALMEAARNPNVEVMNTLLKSGANVNYEFMGDMTILMLAARENSNPEVVIALIKAGANVNAVDLDNKTAFDHAKQNNRIKNSAAYRRLESVGKNTTPQKAQLELISARPIDTINVREAPSLNAKAVASLAAGDRWVLLVDAKPIFNNSDGRNWYKVHSYYQVDQRGNRQGNVQNISGEWYVSERVIEFF